MLMPIHPHNGLHENIDLDMYLGWNAASSSRLATFSRSPAHLRYEMDNPQDKEALRDGAGIHLAVLQPELLPERYAFIAPGDGRTKEYKELKAKTEAENPGKPIVKNTDLDRWMSIARAVNNHDTAAGLLQGMHELSGLEIDLKTGVLCKIRVDALNPSLGVAVDLKTTQDARPDAFERTIWAYKYYLQGALYRRILRALGVEIQEFIFVAVEKEPPHGIGVYSLSDKVLDLGDRELDALLPRYLNAVKTNNWPGYDSALQVIGLPAWATKKLEKDNV